MPTQWYIKISLIERHINNNTVSIKEECIYCSKIQATDNKQTIKHITHHDRRSSYRKPDNVTSKAVTLPLDNVIKINYGRIN